MAKANNNMMALFNLFLTLSLLLFISMVDGRLFGLDSEKQDPTPICFSIYGVEEGDTCFEIVNQFNLTSSFFSNINPNVDCSKLFVGQWLCTSGTV